MATRSNQSGNAGRLANFLETLSIVLVNGALAGVGFIMAALLFTWATATFAAESPQGTGERSGALMLRSPDNARQFAAPRLDTDVTIRVTGMIARVRVVQRFTNPHDAWYEGVYIFPLPENAAVDTLDMRIGERVVAGVIKEREAARRTYEKARASGAKASLLEQERPNIFTSTVANIAPGETIEVEIEYQQTVRYADERFSLHFPLVVAPRYIPGQPASEPPQGTGWSPDTDQVPDASRITPHVMHPRELPEGLRNPVRIVIELNAGVPVSRIDSSSHQLLTEQIDATNYRIALDQGIVAADRDFTLSWTPTAGTAPRAAFFLEQHKGKDYGLLMVMPPGGDYIPVRLPREVIFVIDTSGSMTGASIEQARQALLLALERLAPGDRFNVIEFNSVTRAFANDALPATPVHVRRAVAWVSGLSANGGTEIASALRTALNRSNDPQVLRQVIFLTDAGVGNEEELFALIADRLGDSRLFTIGIGSAPNSYFMSKAAQVGGGTYTYIGRIEEVAEKMSELYAKLESPAMKDLRVEWSGDVEAWPGRIPDLYHGEPVLVAVRADRLTGPIRIHGAQGAIRWSQVLPLRNGQPNAGISKLWARAKIDALMDEQRERQSADGAREAVIDVALEHGLVSKYTSLVAVEVAPSRPADGPLQSGAIPNQLPDGWVHEAVFGSLPQTATPAQLHMLLGAVALAFALLLGAAQMRRRGTHG